MVSSNNIPTNMQIQDEEINHTGTCCDRLCCSCFAHWWNGEFAHQRFIVRIIEKTAFHVLIVLLVLLDCVLVIAEVLLDFILLNQQCKEKNTTEHSSHGSTEVKLEIAIEALHYTSIVILGFFVFELLVKIYAFGKEWWNIRNKKMEWVDAVIVIISFIVDVYFPVHPSVLIEFSVLFISLRLWRIVRIVHSVVESTRSEEEGKKKNLSRIYTEIIRHMLVISMKKTDILTELQTNFSHEKLDEIIQEFNYIDNACQSTVQHCPKFSSRHAAKDLDNHLQQLLEQIRHMSSKIN